MTVEPIALTKTIIESKTTDKLRVRVVRMAVERLDTDGNVVGEFALIREGENIPDGLLLEAQKEAKTDIEAKVAAAIVEKEVGK